MGVFDNFPYTNFHELNLMWILEALKEIQTTTEQFVAINSLKYADPIQWNIVQQYEKNTIVIDPITGTAYISVQAVPSGVSLTNEDYWTVVFDLGAFVTRASKNFTNRVESETTLTATFNSVIGDWLVWGDTLYKAISNITAGDQYVVDSNIEHFTMADLYYQYLNTVTHILTVIGDINDLTTSDTTDLVKAINSVLSDLNSAIGDLSELTTPDTSDIVNAINSLSDNILSIIGDLNDLTVEDKTSVVYAINSLRANIFDIIGDLNDLLTTDKSSVVNAINEIRFDLNNLTDRRFVLIGDSYLEGANHHPDNTWTYDIRSWGEFFDDYTGKTSIKIAVGGAGIGGQIYNSWIDEFNNTTISDPETVTDVIVGGSANDIGLYCTVANMLTGAYNLAAAIKTKCPNARLWIADVGYTINNAATQQSILVHTVYTWFGQYGYALMGGVQNILACEDRLQWDGLHPTELGQMYIGLAIYNNILGLPYTDEKGGAQASLNGMLFNMYNKDNELIISKSGSEVVVFDPVLSGTYSGMDGVSVEITTTPQSLWINSSTTNNVHTTAGYAYIGADIYPAVFQFAIINNKLYLFPIIMQGTGYYTGSIATLVIPNFGMRFPVTFT